MVGIAIVPVLQKRKLRPKIRQLVGSLTAESALNFYTLLLLSLRLREKGFVKTQKVCVILGKHSFVVVQARLP